MEDRLFMKECLDLSCIAMIQTSLIKCKVLTLGILTQNFSSLFLLVSWGPTQRTGLGPVCTPPASLAPVWQVACSCSQGVGRTSQLTLLPGDSISSSPEDFWANRWLSSLSDLQTETRFMRLLINAPCWLILHIHHLYHWAHLVFQPI